MAIYKPSNLDPNLQEIDLNLTVPVIANPNEPTVEEIQSMSKNAPWRNNIFQAQVNTSGENVVAYKMWLYDNNTEDKIWESYSISLRTTKTGVFAQDGVKNKDFVKTYYDSSDNIIPYIYNITTGKDDTNKNANYIISKLNNYLNQYGVFKNINLFDNGRIFQWLMRMYTAPLGSKEQPKTKVCDGFLVGSTGYALWTGVNKNASTSEIEIFEELNNNLIYDRYIQLPIPTLENTFPSNYRDNHRSDINDPTKFQRIKIDWVEKGLGLNKNITKIELVDNAHYNFIDGTEFEIYLCDNKHTYTSIYADPNNQLEVSLVLSLCVNKNVIDENRYQNKYTNVTNLNDMTKFNPLPLPGIICFNRIIGLSTVTGEIRLEQPLEDIPIDGRYYVLYTYNRQEQTLTLVENQNYEKQRIGGVSVGTGKIMNNRWDNTVQRLFIQPNINIKSDDTNPNEIVFTKNGVRVDILKLNEPMKNSVNENDWTFDKLDNTQWLLENIPDIDNNPYTLEEKRLEAFTSQGVPITASTNPNIATNANDEVPIAPGVNYTVYTDFMDNSPNALVYTRQSPEINIYFKNLNPDINSTDYIEISTLGENETKPWRDIEFNTKWISKDEVLIKYYYYQLYYINNNGTEQLIGESEETYSNILYWNFRGFQTDNVGVIPEAQKYKIKITIMDELNREFTQEGIFSILYKTSEAEAPLNIEYDCDKQAFKIHAETPIYATQTNYEGNSFVTLEDIDKEEDIVHIPINKVMNYTTVLAEGNPNVEFMKPFSFLTQFRLRKDFIENIPNGGEATICEVACYKDPNNLELGYDKYSLKISSFLTFYINESTNTIMQNDNRLRLKWYKNDETNPLMCFDNGTNNYYDIIANDPSQEVVLPEKLAYALQSTSIDNSADGTYYTVVTSLPTTGLVNRCYVLTQEYILNQQIYRPGVYKYDALKGWYPETEKEFIFAETLSQLPGYTYDSFSVPKNARYSGVISSNKNNVINYTDISNVWVDDFNFVSELSKIALEEKWFMSYLVINRKNGVDTERAYIQINKERIV